jgi:hypothetical protein
MVSGNNINIGVFTDIGYPGKELVYHFKQCHAAFLETNYCEDMLERGSYPRYLKKRISGKKGHLSNTQSLVLFKKHKPKHLTHLILSHLSENNNKPGLVDELFKPYANGTKIIVASRYEETEVFHISSSIVVRSSRFTTRPKQHETQLSLF